MRSEPPQVPWPFPGFVLNPSLLCQVKLPSRFAHSIILLSWDGQLDSKENHPIPVQGSGFEYHFRNGTSCETGWLNPGRLVLLPVGFHLTLCCLPVDCSGDDCPCAVLNRTQGSHKPSMTPHWVWMESLDTETRCLPPLTLDWQLPDLTWSVTWGSITGF